MIIYNTIPKGARVILEQKPYCSSIKELAEKTGYKIGTVYFYLCYYGENNFMKIGRKKRIIEQLKNGVKQADIARQNQVSRQYVSKLKMEMYK